jgi:hypothetical protein
MGLRLFAPGSASVASIPNVVAVNNRAAPQFGLLDLLRNINSAATSR